MARIEGAVAPGSPLEETLTMVEAASGVEGMVGAGVVEPPQLPAVQVLSPLETDLADEMAVVGVQLKRLVLIDRRADVLWALKRLAKQAKTGPV